MIAAGLDPDTGKGFWCFRGTMVGDPFGECRRTQDACVDQFLRRERTGLVAEHRRCQRHVEAACFQVTRDLEEGERTMCFDSMATCDRIRGKVDPEGFVAAPTACVVAG